MSLESCNTTTDLAAGTRLGESRRVMRLTFRSLGLFALGLTILACPSAGEPVTGPDANVNEVTNHDSSGEVEPVDVSSDQLGLDTTQDLTEDATELPEADSGGDTAPPDIPPADPDGMLGSPCETDAECVAPSGACLWGFCTAYCKSSSGQNLPDVCDEKSAASLFGDLPFGCPLDGLTCMPSVTSLTVVACERTADCTSLGIDWVCGTYMTDDDNLRGQCVPGGKRLAVGESCAAHFDCASVQCLDGACAEHCDTHAGCAEGTICLGYGWTFAGSPEPVTFHSGMCIALNGPLNPCSAQDDCAAGTTCMGFPDSESLYMKWYCTYRSEGGAKGGVGCVADSQCLTGSCQDRNFDTKICYEGCFTDSDCSSGMICGLQPLPEPYATEQWAGSCGYGLEGDFCQVDGPSSWCKSALDCAVQPGDWPYGICEFCSPNCTGKDCGDDGCGGSCGSCDDGADCTTDSCTASGACLFSPNATTCDDGDPCTIDACQVTDGCTHVSECSDTNKSVCTPTGGGVECSCDAGYGDNGGVCMSLTPCDPNPCTGPQSLCTESGFDFSCSCPNPDAIGPGCLPPCPGQHFDGDSFEPNECIGQARSLSPSESGWSIATEWATLGPEVSDVDWFAVEAKPGAVYWRLLNSSQPICGSPDASIIDTSWHFISQLDANENSTPFECKSNGAVSASHIYSLGLIEFDVHDYDMSDSASSPSSVLNSKGFASDVLQTFSDTDVFEFTTSLPANLSTLGRDVWLDVELTNPADGSYLTSITTKCPASLTPQVCIEITGTGTAVVRVSVSQGSGVPGALSAWRVSW